MIINGTWVKDNIIQPFTFLIFRWGIIQGFTLVQLHQGEFSYLI